MSQAFPPRRVLDWIRSLLAAAAGGRRPAQGPNSDPFGEDASDRRETGRRGYSCWQLAAFYDGKRLPQQLEFKLVQCRDVSRQGFSFYHPTLPRHRWLIIAVGTVPFDFYEAKVVRREPAHFERERGWIIGCRFVRPLRPAARTTA